MLGFEIATCRFDRIYKGGVANRFCTDGPTFFSKIGRFLVACYKIEKLLVKGEKTVYNGIRTRNFSIREAL